MHIALPDVSEALSNPLKVRIEQNGLPSHIRDLIVLN